MGLPGEVDVYMHSLFIECYTVGSSKMDNIGEVKFVLYRNVSYIQGFFNAILIHFGTYTNVLFIEGLLNLGVSF